MQELWQLYDNQGRALPGKGANKDTVFTKALLHAASHVWIWRKTNDQIEILVQKRAADKRTWPNLFDISAAGHIDLGESELDAAIRETREEIGYAPDVSKLEHIGVHRHNSATINTALIENEFRYLYLLEITNETSFSLDDGEVDSILWKPLPVMQYELSDSGLRNNYVPHGDAYFAMLFEALDRITSSSPNSSAYY